MGVRRYDSELIAKDDCLGKVSDTNEYWPHTYHGVSASNIRKIRVSHGIPPAPQKNRRRGRRSEVRARLRAEPLLGKVPDTALAKKHETTRQVVGEVRWRAGIAPCTTNKYRIQDWRYVLLRKVGWQ